MSENLNATVTKLAVKALDTAGVADRDWHSRFKITAPRLARLRSGRAALTDAELNRISRVTGEPWQDLVLGLMGSDNKLTADTRELLSSLHALQRSAAAEAAEHVKRPKQFDVLKQLVRQKSA
jgi:hypothetical protein